MFREVGVFVFLFSSCHEAGEIGVSSWNTLVSSLAIDFEFV